MADAPKDKLRNAVKWAVTFHASDPASDSAQAAFHELIAAVHDHLSQHELWKQLIADDQACISEGRLTVKRGSNG